MAASNGAGVVVVFDFDKTIIDCDSDNWVVDALGATQRFEELLLHLPWNSAIVNHRFLACAPDNHLKLLVHFSLR
jgi:hypothetical protein